MHYDLRDSENDISQKMLNAIEPEAKLTIHKHPTTDKVIVLLRGSVRMNLYDNRGRIINQNVLSSDGMKIYIVPKGAWHNLESLESGTVIFIQKNGKFNPETDTLYLEK